MDNGADSHAITLLHFQAVKLPLYLIILVNVLDEAPRQTKPQALNSSGACCHLSTALFIAASGETSPCGLRKAHRCCKTQQHPLRFNSGPSVLNTLPLLGTAKQNGSPVSLRSESMTLFANSNLLTFPGN